MPTILKTFGCALAIFAVILPPLEAHAGFASIIGKSAARVAFGKAAAKSVGKTAARGAVAKSAGRLEVARIQSVYRRDLIRDSHTPVKHLRQDRLVHRYTTKKQAAYEARYGIGAGSHTTATTDLGRPSAASARKRYGLDHTPEVRTTWRLPEGTPVRMNKALGGKPGVGEINLPAGLSPDARLKGLNIK